MGREKDRFEQLPELLPEGWEEKAKELKAFQRARGIKSPEELLRLVLPYLTEGKSFAGTSAITTLSGGAAISKAAVFRRIRNSAALLRRPCENTCRRAGIIAEKPEWLKDKNVIPYGGSGDVKCGVRRQRHMLRYGLDLFTPAARGFAVTNMKTGEKLSNFKRLGKGGVAMGGRIYGALPGIAYLTSLGAGYVLRIKSRGFRIYDGKKQEIDLLESLSSLKEGETAGMRVQCLINGQYKPVRICAPRKDRGSERAGLERLKKENRRKRGGKEISGLQREGNKYIIAATPLGEEAPAGQALELYRMRRQIEIAFKRLKSLFHYNDLPAVDKESVKAWFYGKLLLAALCETLANAGRFSPPGGNGNKRRASPC